MAHKKREGGIAIVTHQTLINYVIVCSDHSSAVIIAAVIIAAVLIAVVLIAAVLIALQCS